MSKQIYSEKSPVLTVHGSTDTHLSSLSVILTLGDLWLVWTIQQSDKLNPILDTSLTGIL